MNLFEIGFPVFQVWFFYPKTVESTLLSKLFMDTSDVMNTIHELANWEN